MSKNATVKGIDTRLTGERLKDHWVYSSWKYLLMIILVVVGWNLIYSITQYRPPREKKLEVYLLSNSYDADKLAALASEYADIYVGKPEAADGSIEEVNFLTLNFGGNGDTYGPQVLMTLLAALEGDIYMVTEDTLSSFVAQELATPLNAYVEAGVISVPDEYIDSVTRSEILGEDENGNPLYSANRYIYGVPANDMYGLLTEGYVDNRNQYFVVMSYSANPDLAVDLIGRLQQRFTAEKPQALIAEEERLREEIQNLPGTIGAK